MPAGNALVDGNVRRMLGHTRGITARTSLANPGAMPVANNVELPCWVADSSFCRNFWSSDRGWNSDSTHGDNILAAGQDGTELIDDFAVVTPGRGRAVGNAVGIQGQEVRRCWSP